MLLPSRRIGLAPAPTNQRPYPWRFSLGDIVYVLDQPHNAVFKVVGGELWVNFPHLHLEDAKGATWRVPQIRCSPKPITFRKG